MEKNITVELSRDEAQFVLRSIGQGARNISQQATKEVLAYTITRKIEKAQEQSPEDKFLG